MMERFEAMLPDPQCSYADHSARAYTRAQMIEFAQAAEAAAIERCAKALENRNRPDSAAVVRALAKEV